MTDSNSHRLILHPTRAYAKPRDVPRFDAPSIMPRNPFPFHYQMVAWMMTVPGCKVVLHATSREQSRQLMQTMLETFTRLPKCEETKDC